jgi:hypothetical protein
VEPQLTSFRSYFVRISTEDDIPVGAGLLVSESQVLTCAHVVAGALRISDEIGEKPQGAVHLDFPFLGSAAGTAHVEHWMPPRDRVPIRAGILPFCGSLPHRPMVRSLLARRWRENYLAMSSGHTVILEGTTPVCGPMVCCAINSAMVGCKSRTPKELAGRSSRASAAVRWRTNRRVVSWAWWSRLQATRQRRSGSSSPQMY